MSRSTQTLMPSTISKDGARVGARSSNNTVVERYGIVASDADRPTRIITSGSPPLMCFNLHRVGLTRARGSRKWCVEAVSKEGGSSLSCSVIRFVYTFVDTPTVRRSAG